MSRNGERVTPIDWLLSDDTGTSSKTILHVMERTAMPRFGADIPYDPADFGRCYRLLAKFPSYRERLQEVADRYSIWGPMVAAWDELTPLYEQERPTGKCPRLYDRMQALVDEGRIADGWTRTACGWSRDAESVVRFTP